MKAQLSYLLLAILGTASVLAEENSLHLSDRVKVLNQESFGELVMDQASSRLRPGSPWFIKFYAPWCGHCKRLAPTWDEFADKYGDQVNVAVMDCDDKNSSPICAQFDIGGFPTLLLLKGRYSFKYRGERSIEGFAKFALEGGYEEAEKEDLPRKMEGFELYQKQIQKFLNQLGRSTEILFEKVGLGSLPRGAMYGIASMFFIIPIVLMCWVICCMKDDYSDVEESQQQVRQAASRRDKAEKID